jgi:hypothetical protein
VLSSLGDTQSHALKSILQKLFTQTSEWLKVSQCKPDIRIYAVYRYMIHSWLKAFATKALKTSLPLAKKLH